MASISRGTKAGGGLPHFALIVQTVDFETEENFVGNFYNEEGQSEASGEYAVGPESTRSINKMRRFV